ncbi:hypothetical protein CLOM_g18955, partial [Closterium sp. NIES-68]
LGEDDTSDNDSTAASDQEEEDEDGAGRDVRKRNESLGRESGEATKVTRTRERRQEVRKVTTKCRQRTRMGMVRKSMLMRMSRRMRVVTLESRTTTNMTMRMSWMMRMLTKLLLRMLTTVLMRMPMKMLMKLALRGGERKHE